MELKLSGRFLGRRTDRRRLDRDQAQVRIENSEVVQGIGQVRLKVPLEVHLEGASFVRRQRRRQRLRRRQQQPEGIDQTVDVCLGRLVRKRQKRRQQQQED